MPTTCVFVERYEDTTLILNLDRILCVNFSTLQIKCAVYMVKYFSYFFYRNQHDISFKWSPHIPIPAPNILLFFFFFFFLFVFFTEKKLYLELPYIFTLSIWMLYLLTMLNVIFWRHVLMCKNCQMCGKQGRPWSVVIFYGIWPGTTLVA